MTADTWPALEMADLAAKGLVPVAGGTLDQAATFLEAARFTWNEERAAKNELRIAD